MTTMTTHEIVAMRNEYAVDVGTNTYPKNMISEGKNKTCLGCFTCSLYTSISAVSDFL